MPEFVTNRPERRPGVNPERSPWATTAEKQAAPNNPRPLSDPYPGSHAPGEPVPEPPALDRGVTRGLRR